jgi:hypothetical protein
VLREGGGRIDLVRADQPLIFTNPTSLGWGLVRRGFSGTKHFSTTDAGGGSTPWHISIHAQSMPHGAKLEPEAKTLVAGATRLCGSRSRGRPAGNGAGFVVLTRGADVRRVAFWFHVEVPRLQLDPHRILRGPGLYHGDTAGKASRVSVLPLSAARPGSRSADPARRAGAGVPVHPAAAGRELRDRDRAPCAGNEVSPRLVAGNDENRVVGYTGIPASLNPYQGFDRAEPVVGAVLPDPGTSSSSSTRRLARSRAPSHSASGSTTRHRRRSGSSTTRTRSDGRSASRYTTRAQGSTRTPSTRRSAGSRSA